MLHSFRTSNGTCAKPYPAGDCRSVEPARSPGPTEPSMGGSHQADRQESRCATHAHERNESLACGPAHNHRIFVTAQRTTLEPRSFVSLTGVFEVRARALRLATALISVDFPTFDRPDHDTARLPPSIAFCLFHRADEQWTTQITDRAKDWRTDECYLHTERLYTVGKCRCDKELAGKYLRLGERRERRFTLRGGNPDVLYLL